MPARLSHSGFRGRAGGGTLAHHLPARIEDGVESLQQRLDRAAIERFAQIDAAGDLRQRRQVVLARDLQTGRNGALHHGDKPETALHREMTRQVIGADESHRVGHAGFLARLDHHAVRQGAGPADQRQRSTRAEQKVMGAHEDHLLGPFRIDMRRCVRWVDEDCDVEPPAREIFQHVLGDVAADLHTLDAFARRAAADELEQRHLRKADGEAHAQRLPVRPRSAERQDLIVHRQDALRISEHDLPLRGQAQSRSALGEQLGPDQLLQALHLRTDRGLRKIECATCLGEAAQFGDCHQGPQQFDRYVRLVVSVMHWMAPDARSEIDADVAAGVLPPSPLLVGRIVHGADDL